MKKQQGHFIILCPNTPELHSAVAYKILIFARMGAVDYGRCDDGGFYGECEYCGCDYGRCEYGECEYGGCVRVRVWFRVWVKLWVRVRIRVSGWDMG